jgi:hypothetical protein
VSHLAEGAQSFDGDATGFPAGTLPLGAKDRMIGRVGRFAACFRDARPPERVEHGMATVVGQRWA